jgi:CRP-like cAMP-binding protein
MVYEVLREQHWPDGAARELADSSHVIEYEKGSSIFHAGEPADLLYVLLNGEAKLYYENDEGERLLVDIASSRQPIGRLQLPDASAGESAQRFTAEALSRCTVALITRARVAALGRTLSADAIGRMVHDAAADWARLSERALRYLTLDVRGRLGLAIDDIATRFGIADARGRLIPLRLSHEDFGELIGASRPMVSKHLKALADAGVFFKVSGRYVLARPEVLHLRPARAAGARRKPSAPRPTWRDAPLEVVRRNHLDAAAGKAAR